jgi:hypothetical protein
MTCVFNRIEFFYQTGFCVRFDGILRAAHLTYIPVVPVENL